MKSTPIPTTSRVIVRGRDRQQCARCAMRATNWHHRRLRNIRDEHTHCPCNGITLCGTGTTGCHGWAHANPLLARNSGLIVSRYALPFEQPVFRILDGWVSLTCDGQVNPATDPFGEA